MSTYRLRPLLRGLHLHLPRLPLARTFVTTSPVKRSPTFLGSHRLRWGLASGAALFTFVAILQTDIYADACNEAGNTARRKPASMSSLIRSYIVYTACSVPGLIDWSPTILSTLMSVPVLKQITEAVVRVTFYDQFVGGDSAVGALPVLERLREENKACILAYSVEVDEAEAVGGAKKQGIPIHKQGVQEMIRTIDSAADFEDRHTSANGTRDTWIAVKFSALVPKAQSLINFSEHLVKSRPQSYLAIPFPGAPCSTDLDVLYSPSVNNNAPLTEQDIADLKDLYEDLIEICRRARERNIRVIIDAEYSWYQPAVDALTLALMRQFNKLSANRTDPPNTIQPLIYNTFQSYLRREPAYIRQGLADAKAGNYVLGIKLVRGAYHPHEIAAHHSQGSGTKHKSLSISPDPEPPVWTTKAETDASYNDSVKVILDAIAADIEQSRQVPRPKLASKLSLFGLSWGKEDQLAIKLAAPSIGVLFGSHNWESQKLILDELVKRGLATIVGVLNNGDPIIKIEEAVSRKVSVGQLYGMMDALTNYIVDRTRSSSPFVVKYVPYGSLAEVMPYLSRRAIENKSVLNEGSAAEERQQAAGEIKKRIFG